MERKVISLFWTFLITGSLALAIDAQSIQHFTVNTPFEFSVAGSHPSGR